MACVNLTLLHCVNQTETTLSQSLEMRKGQSMTLARHGMCYLAFTVLETKFESISLWKKYTYV